MSRGEPRNQKSDGLRAGAWSGFLLGISSVPGPFGLLVWVALVPLLGRIDRGLGPREAAWAGFVAGVLFFGIGFGFVPFAAPGFALAVIYPFGVALLAGWVVLFAVGLACLRRVSRPAALLAAPAAWGVLEFARCQEVVVAVPWMHLGYALSDWPRLIQPASWVGVYGVSMWIVAGNVAVVAARSLPVRFGAVLGVAVALPLVAGGLGSSPERPDLEPLRVAAVQPAVSESERHVPQRFHPNLRRLLHLSDRVIARGADLVVWPESAYERDLPRSGDAFLIAVANDLGAPLLTGAWRLPHGDPAIRRNSAVMVDPAGAFVHAADKIHPVPVYERAPTTFVSRALAHAGLWTGRFEPGEASAPIPVERPGGAPFPIGVLVCIDTSYPEVARSLRRKGARAFVVVSNEAGTGRWSAAIHARIARFRAVENRIPLVRVANTGPTLWIDDRGGIPQALPVGEGDAAARAIVPAGPPPLAVRLGDGPVVGTAAGLTLAALGAAVAVPRRPRFDP